MRQRLAIVMILLVLGIGVVLVWRSVGADDDALVAAQVVDVDALALPVVGFQAVDGKYDWRFPADFGPHPDFQREQWQLITNDNCAVALNIQFERVSLLPDALMPDRESAWAAQSTVIGQATIRHNGDVVVDHTLTSRVAIGLAGATAEQVWVEDWVLNFADNTLVIRNRDGVLTGDLTFDDPRDPMMDESWYSYQRPAELRGQLSADETTTFICAVTLLHRFGSVS